MTKINTEKICTYAISEKMLDFGGFVHIDRFELYSVVYNLAKLLSNSGR